MRITTATRTAVALAVLLDLAACASTDGAEPIRIGLAGPLGQPSGRAMRFAAEMAVEEINAAGGIHGRPLALVAKDDRADAARAIEVAAELRDDPSIAAVIGHFNSAATLGAARIYNDERRGVVQITPSSTSPLVADAGDWTFRVCPSDVQHAAGLAGWVRERLGIRRATILYQNDGYGRGVLTTFEDAFRDVGIAVTSADPFLPDIMEGEDAFDPYLLRAMRDGTELIVIGSLAQPAAPIIRAARRLGFRGPIIGNYTVRDLGALADGVIVSLPAAVDDSSTFTRAYVERFDDVPDLAAPMTYDAVHLLARALRDVGPDRRALRDYLVSVGTASPAFQGVAREITFDENGDLAAPPATIATVRRGRYVVAP